MKKLTAERLRSLLSYDPQTGLFTRLTSNKRGSNVGDIAGNCRKSGGYIYIYVDGAVHGGARLVHLYMTGYHPKNHMDHIDGNPSNNRWDNLRDVPRFINAQNERRARKNNKSGMTGAYWHAKKWQASIRINGETKTLGSFLTAKEAHAAYLAAKRIHHPGFTL